MKSGDLSNNQSNENNRAENGNWETEQTQAVEQSEESGETKNDCIKKENCFVPIYDKGKKSQTQRKKRKIGIIIACIAVVLIAAITTISVYDARHISKAEYCGRKDLISFTIPDGVKYISENAFEDCTNLTSVKIPDSVERIGARAFRHCTSLRE